jgi:hypothetical protein
MHSAAASNVPAEWNDDEVVITELVTMEVPATVEPMAEVPEAIQQVSMEEIPTSTKSMIQEVDLEVTLERQEQVLKELEICWKLKSVNAHICMLMEELEPTLGEHTPSSVRSVSAVKTTATWSIANTNSPS